MNDQQLWLPVVGFEGYYEVSNSGLIKGVARMAINRGDLINVQSKILRPKFDKDCYLNVSLQINGESFTKRMHRMVAEVFVPNPENLPIPDHLNGVRWDNRSVNLKWTTYQGNMISAYTSGRKIVTGRPINKLTLEGVFIKRYECIVRVEDEGYKSRHINNVVKGKDARKKTAYGFRWEYAD